MQFLLFLSAKNYNNNTKRQTKYLHRQHNDATSCASFASILTL